MAGPAFAEPVTIRVTVEDVKPETDPPAVVQDGVKWLTELLEQAGYEDVHTTYVKHPRSTVEGKLFAEGTYVGPSPNGGLNRRVDDFSDDYHFIVVEAKDYEDRYLIEVYYRTSHLATFEIGSEKLNLLQGEIITVE